VWRVHIGKLRAVSIHTCLIRALMDNFTEC
jgi:hypothetical protein